MSDDFSITIHNGVLPGALGRITAWHGGYYGHVWGLSVHFEIEVARQLADFVEHYQPGRDLMLLARNDRDLVGGVVVDGAAGNGEARLRWFIVDPNHAGRGIGGRLLDQAMAFCRETGVARINLWTFAGLDAARHLYERAGFRLAEEQAYDDWGRPVRLQRLTLDPRR